MTHLRNGSALVPELLQLRCELLDLGFARSQIDPVSRTFWVSGGVPGCKGEGGSPQMLVSWLLQFHSKRARSAENVVPIKEARLRLAEKAMAPKGGGILGT